MMMNGSSNGHSAPRRTTSTVPGDLGFQLSFPGLELFLTPSEKFNFQNWNEVIRNRSVVHSWTSVLLKNHVASYLPDTLAPNVIALCSFLFLGQCWYLTAAYGEYVPKLTTWLAATHIVVFYVLNQLALIHADRTRQHTSLSDLFKYSCDMGSVVWLTVLTLYCLGWKDPGISWYAVQSTELVLFLKHLSAFKRNDGLRYRFFLSPGEVLVACILLLILQGTGTWNYLSNQVPENVKSSSFVTRLSAEDWIRHVYYALFTASMIQSYMVKTGWTRFGCMASLGMRFVPALLLQLLRNSDSDYQLTSLDVICDGLFLTVLTSDLTLAKMARRGLHPWVVLMSLAAVLSHSVILILVATYYIAVFADLCFYLNLPLLATCRNVYCDGVYDLCHIGHKRAFQNALSLGNRLLVGVVGDADASSYKRPPIMTHAERCEEVQACKAVSKVIPNAPCFGLTQEFLDEHQIHVVAFGEEYLEKYPDPKDDPYYGYVRSIGIARPLPRTNTLSTTDLINRILKAGMVDKKSPT
jgi:choline-phosphate cytidylyltransferase